MGVKLTGPVGNVIDVPEEAADYWRSLGFVGEKAAPAAKPATEAPTKKATAAKKATSTKKSS